MPTAMVHPALRRHRAVPDDPAANGFRLRLRLGRNDGREKTPASPAEVQVTRARKDSASLAGASQPVCWTDFTAPLASTMQLMVRLPALSSTWK